MFNDDAQTVPFKCIGRKQQSYCLSIHYNISLYDRLFIMTQLFVDNVSKNEKNY